MANNIALLLCTLYLTSSRPSLSVIVQGNFYFGNFYFIHSPNESLLCVKRFLWLQSKTLKGWKDRYVTLLKRYEIHVPTSHLSVRQAAHSGPSLGSYGQTQQARSSEHFCKHLIGSLDLGTTREQIKNALWNKRKSRWLLWLQWGKRSSVGQ